MKKWMIPAVTLCLVAATVNGPASAFKMPWNKSQTQTDDSSKSTDKSQSTDPQNGSSPDSTAPADASSGTTPSTSNNGPVPKIQLQSPVTDEVNGLKVEDPVDSHVAPPDKTYVAIDDPKNPLGITTSADKLNASAELIAQKRYKDAANILNPLKDWLTDATEAHINLYKTLKNVPSAQVQAELEKQLALQFALLRDKAFFQLGMLSVGEQDYTNAIKNLSRVIQSQPRSEMGSQAYEVLQKIGFTEKIQIKEDSKHVSQQTP